MYEPLKAYNFQVEFLDVVHPVSLEDVSDHLKLAVETVMLDKVAKIVEITFRLFKDGILDIYECLNEQQDLILRIKYITSDNKEAFCYDLEQVTIIKAETKMCYMTDNDLLKEKITFQYEILNEVR